VWEHDTPLHPDVQARLDAGYLTRCREDGTTWVPEGTDGPAVEPPPGKNEAKRLWVGHTVRVHGLGVDDAEAQTRADLQGLCTCTPGEG
jgi:hypothetical protein